ncbi:MAG: hypothetical protein ABI600_18930 [Luteolibacter sp.]
MTTPVAGVEWLGPETNPRVRLKVDKADAPVCVRIALPGILPVDWLHVRVCMKSNGLEVGQNFWDDGRCIVEWHPAGGGPPENDSVASVRENDPGEVLDLVLSPKGASAIPVLRLEHLGRAGDFELTRFEATVVRETRIWKIGRWGLMIGGLVWAYSLISSFGGKERVRCLMAAALWVVMGIYFVVPGPWKNLRPLAAPFNLGPEVAPPPSVGSLTKSKAVDSHPPSAVVRSVGNIPLKGDLTLLIKFHFFKLRPVLHSLLLFAPALLIALLVGWRPALWLATLFALAIEGAEAAFGYGFDWLDVTDLISDALGIVIGLLLARRLLAWRLSRCHTRI